MTISTDNSHVFFNNWHSTYPVAERAEGIYIYDQEGKRYLDGIGGMFVVTIGHGVAEVADAMAEQARKLCFVNRAHFVHDSQEQLADLVIEMAPPGMDRVFFVPTGSTANETALQIAREYHIERGNPAKSRFISLWHNYHGSTIGTLSMSGNLATRRNMNMEPYFLDFPHIQPPYCYQCPFKLKHPACNTFCADTLATTIEQEGPNSIAAFIVTPIIGGTAGAVVPPPDYFKRIREICDFYDILLISDEVITGFGRLGKNFGLDLWEVTPDIITVGKTLSSGYIPLAGMIVHQRIWDTFRYGKRKHITLLSTFSNHPVSCATGLAVQNYAHKHNLIERCATMGVYLKQALQKLAEREPLIGDIRGEGLFLGVEFVQDKTTRKPFPRSQQLMEKILAAAFKQGLILSGRFGIGTQIDGDHISICPPFTITEQQCDELVSMLENSLQQVSKNL
jgi:adenosylmethionine-8-amino-7-oxononanoate aminotransferase